MNYVDGETDTTSAPTAHIASWTTFDAQLAYTPDVDWGPVKGLRAAISVQNLMDRSPPRIALGDTSYYGIGFDSTNASALGRFISGSLSVRW
jgi:iron complex outermembrane recepter protein